MGGERVGIREILSDRGVRSIIGLAFLVMAGFGIALPILPLYARSFDVGYGTASLLIASYSLVRLGTDVVAGSLVDRFGERRAGATGLCVTAACALATGLAPSFGVAMVFWGAGGAGSAVMFAAFYSFLLRSVPKERMARTLSFFYGAFNGGMIAGGPIGGLVAGRFGLGAPLIVYACVLAFAAFVYIRFIPDPPRSRVEPSPERAGRTALGRLFAIRGFRTVMLVNLAYMWMIGAVFNTLVPFFSRYELGLSTFGVGALFAVVLVAEAIVMYPAGVAADRRGRRAVLVPAFAGLAVATAVAGFATTPLLFGAVLVGLGLASGFAGVPPAAMLADITPDDVSGTAIGAFRFFGDIGLMCGPVVAGYATKGLGFEAAFAIAAIPTALAVLVVSRARETLPT